MLPPGRLFFLLSHQNLPADTDPPAKGGQTSPHTAPRSAVLPLPPQSPRNTFSRNVWRFFPQGKKLVSVALDAGQMCVDQMNSSLDFPRFLDRKK